MSLRPPLHVSTFHSRTVVSMFGRLCHLLVHALSSLQVANAQCMTLRSLAPCLRAAREKHRFAAGKNSGTQKSTFGSSLAAGKSCFRSGEKTPAKNAASQREKTVRGGKKPVRGKKKTGRGRKKNSSRESPALQPKKLPHRKKYISAGRICEACSRNIFSRATTSAAHCLEQLSSRLHLCLEVAASVDRNESCTKTIDGQICITDEFKPKGANVAWNVNYINVYPSFRWSEIPSPQFEDETVARAGADGSAGAACDVFRC